MYLLLIGVSFAVMIITFVIAGESYEHDEVYLGMAFISLICLLVFTVLGFMNGFISHPKTEGTHQGVITAVDLEGIKFRHYNIYLKSSGYTEQSDETTYCLYNDELELKEELQNAIGKQVKLHYGHDGGYIPWNSCGTYHIKSVEVLEEEK